ncbi:MAG: carboxypeptidase-like regulatory domain-containing protein, partial [Bryobacteraceae bacterium]
GSGVYLFPALQPGLYRVRSEHPGFRAIVFNDVLLEVGARININIEMEVGAVVDTVEVVATDETTLGFITSSVGGLVTGQKIRDLPLINHNALSLVFIHAGLVGGNFSGARIGTLNISLDGINVQDQRINSGVASPIFASTDRVAEFRIVTSPADAELGRGSGQIQMITHSGTNEFHGSLFNQHRNTVLNANAWFSNQAGRNPATGEEIAPRNLLIRNQYGARVGGPVLRNRTFFHAGYEGQKVRTRNAVSATTYTESARRGLFRFFPGVRNASSTGLVPTVDQSGNPIRPATATGDLQTVGLFGRDPNRLAADRSGAIQKMFDLMPLPNDFRGGDGLNTAWHTWIRSGSNDFNQLTAKVDHNLNDAHRLTFSYNFEDANSRNAFL